MERIGVAIDLGTSGIRAQAMDLDSGAIRSTCISLAHPLPGANLMDHLHFVIALGGSVASRILRTAVNKMIRGLGISEETIKRLAVCGNPVQLSLFQGVEVRDLAYTGKRKPAELGIAIPDRDGAILPAASLEGLMLPEACEVVIPPAVCHTVGADGLAMILQSGIQKETGPAMVTDYGTNAEMALFCEGRIVTASAAAGPALEGQHLSCGMLAGPGAVTDVRPLSRSRFQTMVLDQGMLPVQGPLVDLEKKYPVADTEYNLRGITGAGSLSVFYEAMQAGHVRLPEILTPDGRLHLGRDIHLDEADLLAAGKAIGAIRAGHVTLCHEVGIGYGDVPTVYMAGATGTYADPVKAQRMGLLPCRASSVIQVGNTSLKMARDLVMDKDRLGEMREMARRLRRDHCMLAASEIFKKIYVLELSYWTEGMPMDSYRSLLVRYGLKDFPDGTVTPHVRRENQLDIEALGKMGLQVIDDIGATVSRPVAGCTACGACVDQCPQSALALREEDVLPAILLNQGRCAGVSCRQCEQACAEKVFHLVEFFSVNALEGEGNRH